MMHSEIKRLVVFLLKSLIIIRNFLFFSLPLTQFRRKLCMHLFFQLPNHALPLQHITPYLIPRMRLIPALRFLLHTLIRQYQFILLRLRLHEFNQLSLCIQRWMHILHRPVHCLNNHRLRHFVRPRLDHHHLAIFTRHDEIHHAPLALFRTQKCLELTIHASNS